MHNWLKSYTMVMTLRVIALDVRRTQHPRRHRRAASGFLARHDKGHRLSPSDINYRANIDVLKRAGVTDLVSLSACGSFKEDLPPGTFVLIDQFVDRTYKRESSFFGKGCKIARNFDPTFKVSQRIDLVAKYWNWEVHLSRPIVTPPEKWILTSNQ